MQRRNFLAVLGGLPFLGWLKPTPRLAWTTSYFTTYEYRGEKRWWAHRNVPLPSREVSVKLVEAAHLQIRTHGFKKGSFGNHRHDAARCRYWNYEVV